MAWFDRNPGGKKGPEEERPAAPEPRQVAAAAQPVPSEPAPVKEPPRPVESRLVAALHKGSRVSGQLSFQGAARIDGSVEGAIQCHGKLTIVEGAEVRAKISEQVVIIQHRPVANETAKAEIERIEA